MPATITIPYDVLLPYFRGEAKHSFYEASKVKHDAFKPHSEGGFPGELIHFRRPNEPLEVQTYRAQIWKAITKPTFMRVLASLSKIRRSQEWVINYPEEVDSFTKIAIGETLENYCENDFPYFDSITNWMFSVVLKTYLTDSNAVIFIKPLKYQVEQNEYIEPFPSLHASKDVVQLIEEEYAIINDPEGNFYTKGKTQVLGKAFFVVSTTSIERWVQIDSKENYDQQTYYEHGLGELPVFKLGGIIVESQGYNYLYESRISGILPELDEAVREYSDLQASKVSHVYLERWEYTNQECTHCKGTGIRKNPNWFAGCGADVTATVVCDKCTGGYIVSGPYSKMLVKPADTGKQQVPMPPAGYVQRDVAIVELMERSVRDHIFYALAAINFQFLEQTPLNQSGKAKEVDKDELNNTVHSIAEDLIKIMDSVYKFTAYYRYIGLYSIEEIEGMLPEIPVPQKYDLLSTTFLVEELNTSRTVKMNPVIVNALEVDYAGKRFSIAPEIRDIVELSVKLDPLASIDEGDKVSKLTNKGITQESYIISSNIHEFILRALEENAEFGTLTLSEQNAKMLEYAQEVLQNTSTNAQILRDKTLSGLLAGDGTTPYDAAAAAAALKTGEQNPAQQFRDPQKAIIPGSPVPLQLITN